MIKYLKKKSFNNFTSNLKYAPLTLLITHFLCKIKKKCVLIDLIYLFKIRQFSLNHSSIYEYIYIIYSDTFFKPFAYNYY